MSLIRGNMETVISLSKSTCYYMKTGKCSLHIIGDYYVSPSGKLAANDLLYCPHLYHAMKTTEKNKAITILPCECGHAEVVSGHQRACIASRTRLPLAVRAADDRDDQPFCSVCDGQITFESKNTGGIQIVTVKAIVQTQDDPAPDDEDEE